MMRATIAMINVTVNMIIYLLSVMKFKPC